MQKCEHGVYIPAGESKAIYCTGCNPGGVNSTRKVVLPRQSNSPLNIEGQANGKRPGACPDCGEVAHFEVSATVWQCAGCDTKYKAPRHVVRAARLAEMQEAAVD